MKCYVPVYFDWPENTQDLTYEEKGKLIDAIICYASGREFEHLVTGPVRIAFRFLKGQVDRNTVISETRSRAGGSRVKAGQISCKGRTETGRQP